MQIMKLSFSLLFQKQNSVHIQYFSLNEKDDGFEYERIETSSPLYNSFCNCLILYLSIKHFFSPSLKIEHRKV